MSVELRPARLAELEHGLEVGDVALREDHVHEHAQAPLSRQGRRPASRARSRGPRSSSFTSAAASRGDHDLVEWSSRAGDSRCRRAVVMTTAVRIPASCDTRTARGSRAQGRLARLELIRSVPSGQLTDQLAPLVRGHEPGADLGAADNTRTSGAGVEQRGLHLEGRHPRKRPAAKRAGHLQVTGPDHVGGSGRSGRRGRRASRRAR